MKMLKDLLNRYSSLQIFFKSFFLLVIIFLIFFSVNLFITIQNRPKSAYTVLNTEEEKAKLKLQDTRVHNWNELEKK